MKTFTMKTEYATYENCYFVIDNYILDNSLYIEVHNHTEGLILVLTVCLGDIGGLDNCAYIDTNNFPFAHKFIEDNNFGIFMQEYVHSGFCKYPLFCFDIDRLKEYSIELD